MAKESRIDEPGSDALLLRGLMLKLAAVNRALDGDGDDAAKLKAVRRALERAGHG